MNAVLPLFEGLTHGLILYYFIANSIFFLLLFASFFAIRRVVHTRPMIESLKKRSSLIDPPISVIAAAFNEEQSIVDSTHSFLLLDYPDHEVIVVNDGSSDATLENLKKAFHLVPTEIFYDSRLSRSKIREVYRSLEYKNLIVVDKVNGGKADAINVGIGYSKNELFCAVDSDSILDTDALIKVVVPFIENPETAASGGTVRPVNGSIVHKGRVVKSRLPKNPLALVQIVEYLRAFLFGRVGWNVLNSVLIISGAFGLFRRDAVLRAGGYLRGALSEDMELIVRLRRIARDNDEPISIAFVPDPICWTQVPADFRTLANQRNRWQRGLAETLLKNRQMLFNGKYGLAGLLAFPYFLVVELIGPFVDILALLVLIVGLSFQWIHTELFFLFLLVDIFFGILMSFGAVLIEESAYHRYPKLPQLLLLIFFALVENLGFRQFTSLHRFIGLFAYAFGDRSWGRMQREGF